MVDIIDVINLKHENQKEIMGLKDKFLKKDLTRKDSSKKKNVNYLYKLKNKFDDKQHEQKIERMKLAVTLKTKIMKRK